eukprot:COSAG06_NODE_6290_length_2996_cov_17.570935_2_plen_75_part_00
MIIIGKNLLLLLLMMMMVMLTMMFKFLELCTAGYYRTAGCCLLSLAQGSGRPRRRRLQHGARRVESCDGAKTHT